MKKKLLSLALACGMVFSLAACGTPANNGSLKVLSQFGLYLFFIELGSII